MPSPWKHPTTGTYYLRDRVPLALLPKVRGRSLSIVVDGLTSQIKVGELVKVSLRTKEPTLARQRYRDVSAQVARQFDGHAKGVQVLNALQVTGLAGLAYQRQVAQVRAEPGLPEAMEGARRVFAAIKTDPAAQEREMEPFVDDVLAHVGMIVDEGSRARLRKAIAAAMEHAFTELARNAEGDYRPDPEAAKSTPS